MNVKYSLKGVNPITSLLLILAFLSLGLGTAAAADPIVSIAISDTDVCVGESFDVLIAVDPKGNSLQAVQADLGYDSSKASLTVEDGLMFSNFGIGASGAGFVNAITGVGSGTMTSGNLAVLHVTANAEGTINFDLTGVTTSTGSGPLTPTVNDGTTLTITVCGGNGGDGGGGGSNEPTANIEIEVPDGGEKDTDATIPTSGWVGVPILLTMVVSVAYLLRKKQTK